MSRLLAFACLVLAAFAWVPPYLDRAGVAALGLGFLALALSRAPGGALSGLFARGDAALFEPMPEVESQLTELSARLSAYGDSARNEPPAGRTTSR